MFCYCSDDMQPGGGSMDRLDRPRENMSAGPWYFSGGSPWPDPKDRQPDQRLDSYLSENNQPTKLLT